MLGSADEQLYRRIVEETPDAVIFADRDGIVQLWNGGAEYLFGYRAEEAVGHSLDLIIPERLRTRHWDGYHQVMATGVSRYGREMLAVPGIRKDGERISLEFSIALLRDGEGHPTGIVAVLRDVSVRREKERALQQQLAEAEAKLTSAGVSQPGA